MIRTSPAFAWGMLFSVLVGCGNKQLAGFNAALPNTSAPYLNVTGPNVLPIRVGGGGLCGQVGYENEPCTSVTVCLPATNQCQTITDILLDTGSVGLRLFASSVHLSLPHLLDTTQKELAQCAQFGTGSDWGPLATADVRLGGEPAVTVPIQLIDKSYATPPEECLQADVAAQRSGYNGILGVGLFAEDCGAGCARSASNRIFYACRGGHCDNVALPMSKQPQNPVALLPIDNNGLIVALPQVKVEGAARVIGTLILGIETRPNNSPVDVQAYFTDGLGNFTTHFAGRTFPGSFIDSGSNGLFFPNVTGLKGCAGGNVEGFFCPDDLLQFKAVNLSETGSSSAEVPFQIGNAAVLLTQNLFAIEDLAGTAGSGFDWGLPFFYGRAVFEGLEGRRSSLGTGPYLAY